MNKQLFFGKNIAQNTQADPALLADGEVGIFGINSATYVQEKVVVGTQYDAVWLSIGRGNGKGPLNSRRIGMPIANQELEWRKFPYAAAVLPSFLVYTDCEGKSQYDYFAIRLSVRFGEDFSGMEHSSKTYSVNGKYATAQELYEALAAQINADQQAEVTALGTAGGVQITGKYWDQVINIGAEYGDNPANPECRSCSECSWTVEATNEPSAGSGDQWHLSKLALEAGPYLGAAYYNDRLLTNPAANLDAAVAALGNSDLLYFKWKNAEQAKGDHGDVFNMFQEVFITFPAGTNTGSLETVLNGVFNTTIKTATV